VAQRELGNVKHNVTLPYDASAHRFLRIRHDGASGDVLWETAPSLGGVPGTWTVRRQEAWNTGAIPLSAVRVELKAGTSSAESNPGTVIFDNLKLGRGGVNETVLLWEDFAASSLDTATW